MHLNHEALIQQHGERDKKERRENMKIKKPRTLGSFLHGNFGLMGSLYRILPSEEDGGFFFRVFLLTSSSSCSLEGDCRCGSTLGFIFIFVYICCYWVSLYFSSSFSVVSLAHTPYKHITQHNTLHLLLFSPLAQPNDLNAIIYTAAAY